MNPVNKMLQEIHAPIDVLVLYRQNQPYPEVHSFRWNGRRYPVSVTHLVHVEREGETRYLCYALSSGPEHFHLRLDTSHGVWRLAQRERDEGR